LRDAIAELRQIIEGERVVTVPVGTYFAGGIEVPFGGNRRSGFGREKGLEALRNYCRVKSVAARLS
jgi:aldehyde dehydrogenase (NAD+)/betaine-aldehyde dehydrogenase